MTTLAHLQQRFAERLADARDDADVGIAVYRDTIRANYRNALRASYPAVAASVGAASFDALVDRYVAAHPSICGDLNVYGDTFGDFLAAHPAGCELPYLPDLARLEWSLDEVARAADALGPAAVFDALRQIPAAAMTGALCPLQPDCRLLRSMHPVLRIWRRHQRHADAGHEPESNARDDLLLIRRAADGAQVERVSAAEHAWLSVLAHGGTLGDALGEALAIDTDFDVASAVAARIADGTLGAPTAR